MRGTESLKEIINSTRNWLSEYNPSVLYIWLSILSIHPSNQKYQTRFEFLLAILTSIRKEEFRNRNLNYETFNNYISNFKEKTDSVFFTVEDFSPFSQLKLIPYFFERNKYFFFYGQTERTYELLRILKKLYICETEGHPELILIKDLFKQILNYQTRILEKLVQIEESRETLKNKIYFPSPNFFSEIENLLIINDMEVLDSRFIWSNHINEEVLAENFNKIIFGGYFNKIYLRISDSEFLLILPHIQIEILFKIFEEIVRSSENYKIIEKIIKFNIINKMKNLLISFFHRKDLIEFIVNKKREIISKEDELIVLYDNNLIILKMVDFFSDTDLSSNLNNSYEDINKTLSKIKAEEKVFLNINQHYGYEVPVKELKIIKILLYESIDLSPKSILFSFETNFENSVFSLLDLISIFELTSTPFSFLKFLEEKYNSERYFTFDQIDIFAVFYNNNESLPAFGTDLIMLEPHLWSNFYNNHLYEKFQDTIYELIEREFPKRFNKVRKWKDNQNLYECLDTRDASSANIIKLDEKLIWIFNPYLKPPLTLDDLKFPMRVLGPLYADYIERIITEFLELIHSYTSSNKYAIFLIPIEICPNNSNFTQFEVYYSRINEKDPIIVKSFLNRDLKLISIVFYDSILWGEKFIDSKNNDNCKYAMNQLIESIFDFFEPNLSKVEINNKTMEFLQDFFIESERDYFLDVIPIRNQDIKKYHSYIKFNPTDKEKVIKDVESYLREKQTIQKHLSPEESIALYNEIYKVFYERLRDQISQFDINILYFTYNQLELIEGKREMIRLETGMRSPSHIDIDYQDYFEKTYDEISQLSSTLRFIIHNILKFGINGIKKISATEYSYIQALSFYLISISQISDFTFSKLIEYTINIKDYYKFDELRSNSIFDYDAFKEVESKGKLESTRDFYNSIISESKKDYQNLEIPENEKIMIMNIDEAFQFQFSFSFTKMMRVLSILSSSSQSNKDIKFFPSILIQKEDLIKFIKDEYKNEYKDRPSFIEGLNKGITELEIEAILNYLSLDFHSFQDMDILIHLKIMKQKNRLTLCPLIRLNNQFLYGKQCCNVAFQIWRRNIFAGVFPYKIHVDDKVSVALQELHSYQDLIFEDECGNIAKEVLGDDKYIIRLKNFKRISESLPKYPDCGEIDLLAVNLQTKTCFILDAKNYYLKLNPYDIKNEINRFIKNNKADLKKLNKKEKFVIDNFNFFLEFFQITDKENWRFKKGFIIKYNFPSAYIIDVDVDFVFQNELDSYLKF